MPLLLKPSLLITACSLNRRKTLGLGLPICGRGVTVPTSKKPKPNSPKQSIKSPFLSSPAAVPSLFLNISPCNS